jgi:hypothetical protein
MADGDSEPPGRTPLERRDERRFPILGELDGEVMVFQPTGFPFQIDSLHEFRLILGAPIVVKGRVTTAASSMSSRSWFDTGPESSLWNCPNGCTR